MRVLVVIALVVSAACGGPQVAPQQQTEIAGACAIARQRCTRCHTLDRVAAFDARSAEQWSPLVARMRRMTASGISTDDADLVVRCLASPASIARGAP